MDIETHEATSFLNKNVNDITVAESLKGAVLTAAIVAVVPIAVTSVVAGSKAVIAKIKERRAEKASNEFEIV